MSSSVFPPYEGSSSLAKLTGVGATMRPSTRDGGISAPVQSRIELKELRKQNDLAKTSAMFGGKSMRDAYVAAHSSLPPMPTSFAHRQPSAQYFDKKKLYIEPKPLSQFTQALPHTSPARTAQLKSALVKPSSAAFENKRYLSHRSQAEQRPNSGTLEDNRPLYSSFAPDRVFRMNLSDPSATTAQAFARQPGLNQSSRSLGGSGYSGSVLGGTMQSNGSRF